MAETLAVSTTVWPAVAEVGDAVSVVVLAALETVLMVSESGDDVLGRSLVSPVYAAVIECVPADRELNEIDAAAAVIGAVPSRVVPSLN